MNINTIIDGQGYYPDYKVEVIYYTLEGKLQIPIANSNESMVVKTHGRVTYKEVVWFCSGLGSSPKIPDPTPLDSNEVLIDVMISPSLPAFDSTNGLYYSVSGKYKYALKKSLSPKNEYPYPTSPMYEGSIPDGIIHTGKYADINQSVKPKTD